jgi:hypothetical protein
MKSECPSPSPLAPAYQAEELNAHSSRLLDEKISDNNSTEAKADKAMAPAGLKNPFWK